MKILSSFISSALLGAGLLLSPSFAIADAESPQGQSAGVPALVVISPAGRRSIVLGVMHDPAVGLRQPSLALLAFAKRVVLEHLDIPKFPPASLTEARAPWSRRLSQNELATYLLRARCAGQTDEAALAALSRPSSQLANSWAYASCKSPRRSPARSLEELSTEGQFSVMAERYFHIPIAALESDDAAEQQRLLLPNLVAEDEFRSALASDPDDDVAEMVEKLNAGDYEALGRMQHDAASSSMSAAVMYQILVAERNARWMEPLKLYLDEGDAVILVGAGHLSGPQSLPVLLSASGYSTRKVQLPAATPMPNP